MKTINRFLATMACAAAGIALLAAGSAQAQNLILYTASNATIEKDIMAAFSKAHPEIKVDSVGDSPDPSPSGPSRRRPTRRPTSSG